MRDGFLCICGQWATLVHHKRYDNIGDEPLSDLTSLCEECHFDLHAKRKLWGVRVLWASAFIILTRIQCASQHKMKQKITDLQPHSKFTAHHQLFLDKKPFVIIPSKLVENLGLRVGLEIESQTIEKLIAADEAMRAKNFALNILRENIYSKTQMTQQLEREGFKEQTVETIIIELINSGHIRDRLFAEKWIQRRQKSNPRGRTVLKQELVEKGVDPETAEQVLAEVKTEDEAKLALRIAQKQTKQYKRLPIHVAKRRLHGFLARRGFESETILQVIEKVL